MFLGCGIGVVPGVRQQNADEGIAVVNVWDVRTGSRVHELHDVGTGPIATLALTDVDGTVAVTADESALRVWDLANGRRRQLLNGHTGAIRTTVVGSAPAPTRPS